MPDALDARLRESARTFRGSEAAPEPLPPEIVPERIDDILLRSSLRRRNRRRALSALTAVLVVVAAVGALRQPLGIRGPGELNADGQRPAPIGRPDGSSASSPPDGTEPGDHPGPTPSGPAGPGPVITTPTTRAVDDAGNTGDARDQAHDEPAGGQPTAGVTPTSPTEPDGGPDETTAPTTSDPDTPPTLAPSTSPTSPTTTPTTSPTTSPTWITTTTYRPPSTFPPVTRPPSTRPPTTTPPTTTEPTTTVPRPPVGTPSTTRPVIAS